MGRYYILKGREAVEEPDMLTWMEQMGTVDYIIAQNKFGEISVSTVFLGINHGNDQYPMLFETMIFGGINDGMCVRCATYDEAEKNHESLCVLIEAETNA